MLIGLKISKMDISPKIDLLKRQFAGDFVTMLTEVSDRRDKKQVRRASIFMYPRQWKKSVLQIASESQTPK